MRKPAVGAATSAAAAVGAMLLALPAVAASFEWTSAVDGDFDDSNRWSLLSGVGSPPPGSSDSAAFRVAGSYEVTFPSAGSPFRISVLSVTDGDVTFGLFIGGSATLNVTGSASSDANITGGTFTLAGLDLNVADQLYTQGATLNIQSGSDVASQRFFIGGAFFGDGTVNVDGPLSSLTVTGTGTHTLGNGVNAQLHLSNRAMGSFAGTIALGTSGVVGKTATITVDGGSMLDTGSIAAGGLGTTADINVSGTNSSIIQNGAATLTLGGATAGFASLNINGGGSFTTGTGAVTLNPTSSVFVGTAAMPGGTFTANGPLTVDLSSVVLENGGVFNANHDVTIDGGVFNQNAGAGAVTFASGR